MSSRNVFFASPARQQGKVNAYHVTIGKQRLKACMHRVYHHNPDESLVCGNSFKSDVAEYNQPDTDTLA